MRQVDKYIQHAIAIIADKTNKFQNDKGEIPSEYKGYIASFGSAMIQCGLIPAVALFSDINTQSKSERKTLLNAIHKLIQPDTTKPDLLRYVLSLPDTERDQAQATIMHATIALKLALRTFKLAKNNEPEKK